MVLDIVNGFLVNLWFLWTHFNEVFDQVPNFVVVVVVVNALSFKLMCVDKNLSMNRDSRYRVPEKYFHFLVCIGGYRGIYRGMTLFNHKTSKWNFYVRFTFLFAIFTIVIWVAEYNFFTRLIKRINIDYEHVLTNMSEINI